MYRLQQQQHSSKQWAVGLGVTSPNVVYHNDLTMLSDVYITLNEV